MYIFQVKLGGFNTVEISNFRLDRTEVNKIIEKKFISNSGSVIATIFNDNSKKSLIQYEIHSPTRFGP